MQRRTPDNATAQHYRAPAERATAPAIPRGETAIWRAVVLSDVCLYRDVLAASLVEHPGVERAEAAGTIGEALERIGGDASMLVLVDMSAPQSHEAVRALLGGLPTLRIIGFAVPETDDAVIACAELGMAGFVRRNATLQELGDIVACVVRGELPCTPHVAATLFHRLALLASWRRDDEAPRLTVREREIVALIDGGLSNKEIAVRLNIEVPTVKNHVHRILERLQVRRRGEAAARMRSASASGQAPPLVAR